MIIKSMELFQVPPRWLFLKVTTDDGIVGWGEPIVEGKADTVRAAVEEMSDYLIGKDPGHIEDLWQVLYRGGFYRGGPILTSAISGIEQALWDIKGKRLGVPVYELLGGPVRDKMRVYAWIGGDKPSDVAEEARKKMAEGYTAVKMNGTAEMEWIDSPLKVQEAVERLAAVREAIGWDKGIGVDFHGRVHKTMAKVLIKEMEPLKPMFIEEPVLPENNEVIPEITKGVSIPIATGERMYTRWDFKRLLMQGASISSSRISVMPAGYGRCAKSRRWRRPSTLPLRRTARLVRLRWLHRCSWIFARRMRLSRSRAWASITIKAPTCWII